MTAITRTHRSTLTKLILGAALLLGGCATGPAPQLDESSAVVIGYATDGNRTLLLKPVGGGHLSSTYGTRKDPFTGERRAHRGIDFAASSGAPVYAAGDGVVVSVGPRGTYGNYVRIRHDDRFETAYAHLSRFGDDLERGQRVHQRDVIGFVGNSGRSTGPHLHYEILVDGSQIDPFAVEPSIAQSVKGKAIGALHAAQDGFESLRETVAATAADLLD